MWDLTGMVKINKQIEIVIDGDDVETLKNICELARRYIDQHKKHEGDERTVDEYTTQQRGAMENLMQEIFDA